MWNGNVTTTRISQWLRLLTYNQRLAFLPSLLGKVWSEQWDKLLQRPRRENRNSSTLSVEHLMFGPFLALIQINFLHYARVFFLTFAFQAH